MTASPVEVDMRCAACREPIEKVVRIGYGMKAFDWYQLDADGLFDLTDDEQDYDEATYLYEHDGCGQELTHNQQRRLSELMRG